MHCVWSSCAALATSRGRRRRLLDLTSRRGGGNDREVDRATRGAENFHYQIRSPGVPLHFAPPRVEVELEAGVGGVPGLRERRLMTNHNA